ncbi:hypothetical protein ACEPPN_000833 [Leptodophora sp. 'Broadleaf-Isolate-01']
MVSVSSVSSLSCSSPSYISAQSKVDPAIAILDRFGHSPEGKAYAARSGVPATTLWHRNNGRPSIVQKGASQQYLTPQEEKALVTYLLRMAQNGFPLPLALPQSSSVSDRLLPETGGC